MYHANHYSLRFPPSDGMTSKAGHGLLSLVSIIGIFYIDRQMGTLLGETQSGGDGILKLLRPELSDKPLSLGYTSPKKPS